MVDWRFTAAWIIWGLAFIGLEAWALIRSEKGDTLSEQVWALFGVSNVVWFMGAGFLLWLVIHFLSRGRV